ncbi:hypothetical protein CWI03_07130, partial [Streptococcus pneumoniae]|uniref:hypothetical protein n=1 Tax=Streptococcus pneumoniae TaxID=1313 RepID=UPI000F63C39D
KSSNDNDVNLEIGKKHISLKVMTLSNSRQKKMKKFSYPTRQTGEGVKYQSQMVRQWFLIRIFRLSSVA